MFELSLGDFREYSNLYLKSSIDEDLKKCKTIYTELDNYRNDLINLKNNLESQLNTFFDAKNIEEIESISKKYGYIFETNFNIDTFFSSFGEEANYYNEFVKVYDKEKSKYIVKEFIIQQDKNITELTSKKNEIYSKNPQVLNNLSESSEIPNKELIYNLENNYNLSNEKYNIEYKVLVKQYLKNNADRFKDSVDFRELCEEILPSEIFSEIITLEKEVIDKIDKYLKDINLKNKRLNNRKLQKLASIIEEVGFEVSEQRNNIRIIKNFLNSDDKKISGGHIVSLEDENEDSFSPDWMKVFIENINKDFDLGQENSLFDSEKGITNDLERFPSLKEKLLEAFYRSGGSRSLKPSIEDLLNPKSYYTVKYSIKTSLGKKNDGSTSQTYAAISLLCIAKLSLLNKHSKNNHAEAIRFMAIDEAEGLGSNFDLLYNIALANDYQILSLSINPNKIDAERQNIYLLINSLEDEKVNYEPIPIFGLTN